MALDFPDSPVEGQYYEGFNWDDTASVWRVKSNFAYIPVDFLVIAGGGGGGVGANSGSNRGGGGGGAGGYRSSTSLSGTSTPSENPLVLERGVSYTVTIGAGGAGGAGSGQSGTSGEDSVCGPITVTGGGYGSRNAVTGGDGGSGGGGGSQGGQGDGEIGLGADGLGGGTNIGGHGGGAGGLNGLGISNDISGSTVGYAGGGWGTDKGGWLGSGYGSGGSVGSWNTAGIDGTANTGGGGGAAGRVDPSGQAAGDGGSGVVILKYDADFDLNIDAGLTSSTITSGGYKITTFTAGTGTVNF